MMKNKTKNLANDVGFNHTPFALFRVPSKNLVKQVVFSPQEKVDWNLECCSEMSIEHEELFQTKGCATRSSPTPWPKAHHNMTWRKKMGPMSLDPGHIVMFFWHDVGKVLIGHIKPKSFGQRLELGSSEPVQVQRVSHGFFERNIRKLVGWSATSRVL